MNYFTSLNARAINQLCTWFGAVGIRYEISSSNNSLWVWRANGMPIQVVVAVGKEVDVKDVVVVKGEVLTGRKVGDALDHFRKLQIRLGYEPKQPVERGVQPGKKAHYTKDFELVAFRHMEFRRVPNPPAKELRKYDRIVATVVRKFYYQELQLCLDHMLDISDLKTYAMVWATNFIGLHRVPDGRWSTVDENEKFLTTYLKQRLAGFKDLLFKKARNVNSTMDAAFIARNNCPYDYTDKELWFQGKMEDVPVDEGYRLRHQKLNVRTETSRRASAMVLLDQELAALPHNLMVQALKEASENGWIHADAKRLAGRRLREHMQTCQDCVGELPPAEEELAGEDSGSDLE